MAFNDTENQALTGTGLSQVGGPRPGNAAGGTLFQGLGDSLSSALSAYDQETRTKIALDANKTVESVLDSQAMINGDQPVPPEVAAATADIEALKAARAQGVMTDVEFNTTMLRKAKILKARVPAGYADVVDSAISAALGTSTANDLRRSRLSEIGAAQAESDANSKERRRFLDSNQDLLENDSVRAAYKRMTGNDLDSDIAADSWDYNVLRKSFAGERSRKYQQESDLASIAFNKAKAEPVARKAVNNIFQETFNAKVGPYADLIKFKATAESVNSPGGAKITSEEAQQMTAMFEDFATAAGTGINSFLAREEFAELDDPARDGIKKIFSDQLTVLRDALYNENYGALNRLKNEASYISDGTKAELLRNSSVARQIKAAKDLGLPDQTIDSLITMNTKWQDQLSADLETAATWEIMTNEDRSATEILQEGAADAPNAGQYVKTVLDNLSQIMNNPAIKDQDVVKVAKQLFNDKNKDLLKSLTKSGRADAFRALVTPRVIAALSKDTEAMNNLYDWSMNQFDALTKISRDTVIDAQSNNYGIEFKFDGEQFTSNFKSPTWGQMTSLTPPTLSDIQAKTAIKEMANLNNYIAQMKPIWQSQGLSTKDGLNQLFDADVQNIEKNPTLLQMFGSAVYNWVTEDDGMPTPPSNRGAIQNKAPEGTGQSRGSIKKSDNDGTDMKSRSIVAASRRDEDFEDVEVIEEYKNPGKNRRGDPDGVISKIAVAAAHDTGMTKLRMTSGKGDYISPAGKAKGQKSTYHSTGKAVDVAGFEDTDQMLQYIENAVANGANGVGIYKDGSVHIDHGKPRRWSWGGKVPIRDLDAAIERGKARRAQTS